MSASSCKACFGAFLQAAFHAFHRCERLFIVEEGVGSQLVGVLVRAGGHFFLGSGLFFSA